MTLKPIKHPIEVSWENRERERDRKHTGNVQCCFSPRDQSFGLHIKEVKTQSVPNSAARHPRETESAADRLVCVLFKKGDL